MTYDGDDKEACKRQGRTRQVKTGKARPIQDRAIQDGAS